MLRWNPLSGQSELLATGVSEYIPAAGGGSLVYLKPLPMTANGLQRYDLALLDLNTLQVSSLLTQTAALHNPALSPDGRWLAYSLEVENNPIYLLEVRPDHPADPVRLSDCLPASPQQCIHLAWTPDSQSLAWSDRSGVWISGLGPGSARLRHEPVAAMIDPAGEITQLPVQFSAPEWSPAGRFILMQVHPEGSTVSWYAVLDSHTAQLVEISASYCSQPGDGSVVWLPDSRLLVTHASDPLERQPPYVHLIEVLPTRPRLLAVRETFDLASEDFPLIDSSRKIIPVHSVAWPGIPQRGRLPLTVGLVGADSPPMLFNLELQFGRLETLITLPAGIQQVLWSPDGRGGLLAGSAGEVLYYHLDQKRMYNLLPLLGVAPHDFHWLPPVPPT